MHSYKALPTELVHAWRNGAPDDYGNAPERAISSGAGNPCRHCMKNIEAGAPMLILAHRPFEGLHAYAEAGPIFVCADECQAAKTHEPPEILTTSPDYLIKGYSAQERVVYGTGEVVTAARIPEKIETVFKDPRVAFIHIRSARNNCYQLRVDRT